MPKKDQDTNDRQYRHQPVLLKETLDLLLPKKGESYLDVTAGYGGHAECILKETKAPSKVYLVDRDHEAVGFLSRHERLAGCHIIHQDYLTATETLASQKQSFDMILADLGVSSLHLSEADRGFSVRDPGPLDMRMDSTQELSAELLVNNWDEDRIFRVLRDYGEEPKARTIARKIVSGRPIRTTDQLAAIAASVWPGKSRIHPATRTFQAIRIAVNDELQQLKNALPIMSQMLAPGGRMAVISFHSLEDRIVKHYFADISGDSYDAEFVSLTKKPIMAAQDELVSNPRARSAKLRAVAKIKTNRKDNA